MALDRFRRLVFLYTYYEDLIDFGFGFVFYSCLNFNSFISMADFFKYTNSSATSSLKSNFEKLMNECPHHLFSCDVDSNHFPI